VKHRVLSITLAIVLAVLGTAGVLAYAHGADARALAGQKAVSVLVAQDKIPSGTTAGTALQSGMLVGQKLPASAVPSEAVSSITPDVSGLVMGTDVQPGQVLLRPMLVTSSQLTGALAIPQGMVAVTVATCMPGAVAGYVQPGAQVAVFGTYSDIKNNGSQSCGGSGSSAGSGQTDLAHVYTRILLRRVLVLAVGAATASGQNGTSPGSTNPNGSSSTTSQSTVMVTLGVNQADAERLITLDSSGLTYLALLTPSSVTSFDNTLPSLFQP